jgi:hypothetical protein
MLENLPFLDFIRTYENLLLLLGAVSIVTFFGSLLVVPWLVVRIPADYFALEERRIAHYAGRHTALRWSGLIAKNCLGAVLIVMGIAMLILPGQGLLTILIGIVLMNFPGKFRLERWLVQKGPIWRSVNWLRRRAGRRELEIWE